MDRTNGVKWAATYTCLHESLNIYLGLYIDLYNASMTLSGNFGKRLVCLKQTVLTITKVRS